MPTICSECQLELHDEEPAYIEAGEPLCSLCHFRISPACPVCGDPMKVVPKVWAKCKTCKSKVYMRADQYCFPSPLVTAEQRQILSEVLSQHRRFKDVIRVASARWRRSKAPISELATFCQENVVEEMLRQHGKPQHLVSEMGLKALMACVNAADWLNNCLREENTIKCVDYMHKCGPTYWRAANVGDVVWGVLEQEYLRALGSGDLARERDIQSLRVLWLQNESRESNSAVKHLAVLCARLLAKEGHKNCHIVPGCDASCRFSDQTFSPDEIIQSPPFPLEHCSNLENESGHTHCTCSIVSS